MNGADLFNGLSFVDERLINEAEEKKIKKQPVRLVLPIAASIAVIIGIASVWNTNQNNLPTSPGNNPPIINSTSASSEKKYTLNYNKIDSRMAASILIEGHFWEGLTSMQAEKLLPGFATKHEINGTVNYSHVSGVTSLFSVDMNVLINGKNAKIVMAPKEVTKCYVIEGKPVLSEIEGVKIEAGIFTTDYNSKGEQNHIYYGNFKIDDVAYYVEYSGEKNDKDFFASIIAGIVLGGRADLSVLDHPPVPTLRNDTLTESEAYAETTFGAYLPKLPSNYLFSSATRFINQDRDCLFASWSSKYDDFHVTIESLKEQDKKRIVSVQDRELYDMSLYPIPWADSMPGNTREIIENPIFRMEDLTLSVVKMREYVSGEQDESSKDSVKLRFCVLYSDTLVEVSAEGVTSEVLFDVLTKVPRK